jgi:integrase/recombinase XerD
MSKTRHIKTDFEVMAFARANEDITNVTAYFNLMQQFNRLAKHVKGGLSFATHKQYYNKMDLFARFLADEYALQNLANISGKHLAAYIEERQNEGKAAATVDQDLSAIRFYHDQYGTDARHRLPDNILLLQKYGVSLEPRMFGGVNRRWTCQELGKFIDLAIRRNRFEISQMMQLGAGMGLRIHEVVRLSREDAGNALKSGNLYVKGKGGLERDVPLRADIPQLLQAVMLTVTRGAKLFVPEGVKAHQVIQSMQSFISNHRDNIADPAVRLQGVNMTFHGLRHLYAYDRYCEFINQGFTPAAARLKVAQLIGHNRDDVTRIYLAE